MANDIRFRASMQNDAKRELSLLERQLDSVGLRSKGATGAIGKLGLATGGLITPTTLAAGAALGFAGFILGAGKAAGEEQVNIAKLGASLRANVDDWDGNTTAIESTIQAREELAFSDDELRNSLALLLPATHNVAKAFDLQSTAMDLAAFKGISLEDASTALIKIEGGQFRALKALIGSTADITTSEEALAAVRKVASGQALAQSKTLVGAQKELNIAIGDLQEDIGQAVVGPLTDFTNWMRRDAIPLVREFGHNLDETSKKVDDFDPLGLKDQFQGWADAAAEANAAALETADDMKIARAALTDTAAAASAAVPQYDKSRQSFTTMAERMRSDMGLTKKTLKDDFKDLTDYMKDRLTDKELRDLLSGKSSLGKTLLAGLKSSHGDVVEETGTIFDDIKGKMTDTELRDLVNGKNAIGAQLLKDLNSNNKDIRDAARKIFDGLVDELSKRIDITIDVTSKPRPKNAPIPRAGGGPVDPGQTYLVGEHGPETLIMGNGSGTIVPNAGGMTVVYAPQFSTASEPERQRFMRAILPDLRRELSRQGF